MVRRKIKTCGFALMAVCLQTVTAQACRAPSLERHTVSLDRLISESENIYLVMAEIRYGEYVSAGNSKFDLQLDHSCDDGSGYCEIELDILDVIKGRKLALPSVKNGGGASGDDNDFSAHAEKKFWEDGAGRIPLEDTSCGLFAPLNFAVGETHLFFPDFAYAAKAAEIIKSPDDEWLRYVRGRVAEQMQSEQ